MDIENATELFREKYISWLKNPDRLKNGYNYEKTFVAMMQELESAVFQDSLGDIPSSRNLKKKFKRV
jgi:hypothetical protein